MAGSANALVSIECLFQAKAPDLSQNDQFFCGSVIPEYIQYWHEENEQNKGYLGCPSICSNVHVLTLLLKPHRCHDMRHTE